MSYSSLGYVGGLGGGLGLDVGKYRGADLSKAGSAPRVDVGVPASLVRALSAHLKYLASTFGSAKQDQSFTRLAAMYLDAMKLNSFSRYDAAAVAKAVNVLPSHLREFVDRTIVTPRTPTASATVGYTTSKLLADIASGRFAGIAPPESKFSAAIAKTIGSSGGGVDAMKASYDSAADAVKLAQQREAAQKEKARQQAEAEEAERKAKDAATELVKQAQPSEPSAKDLAPVTAQLPAEAFETSLPAIPDSLVLEPGSSEPVPSVAPGAKTDVFTKDGFLGVPWLYVAGIGVGVVAIGYGGWRMSRKPTPNKRRGHKRARRASRRRSK